MEKQLPKRYPGSQPFQREQRPIFFGRDGDIQRLFETVNVFPLTVLHGKSGLGKTSLLNAGVLPKFTEDQNYLACFPRFFAYDGREHLDPLAEILHQLGALAGNDLFFPALAGENAEPSLWRLKKTIEWANRERPGILFVFDQFEELFSYPPDRVDAFGRQFAELALNRMPEVFQQQLYAAIAADPAFAERHAAEIDFIEDAPQFKIVIGIRSDRMSFLDRLKPYLPGILKNTFELQALNREQARAAVVLPAQAPGVFASPSFEYAPETLESILNFLTADAAKPVEGTQLQVICQYAENQVRQTGQVLRPEDLGNISDIYKNYYDSILDSFEPEEQLRVRRLIEEGLIFESEKRRLSLFEGQILHAWKIRPESLAALVNQHHLLRVEPLADGGFSYEVSHDSLVEPILERKAVRVEEETRQREAAEREEERRKEAEQAEKVRRQRFVFMSYSIAMTLLVILAFFSQMRLIRKQEELKKAQKDLEMKSDSVVQLLHFTQLGNDSIAALNEHVIIGNYRYFITHGNALFDQKEFIQAKAIYQNARDFIQNNDPKGPENQAWLDERIWQCDVDQKRQELFESLLDAAQQHMDAQRYGDAYPLYTKAMKLNYDPAAVASNLTLCRSYLEAQVEKYLTQIGSMLEKSKYHAIAKKWAVKAIVDEVDPILQMIQDETNTSKKTLALHEKREQLFRQSTK